MFFFDKLNIQKAVGRRYNHNLSCEHLTTQDFGQLRPTYIRLMNPNEKISVNMSQFCRVAPMAYPVLGDVTVVSRAFFVPFRLLSPSWKDFISNKSAAVVSINDDNTPQVPFIPMHDLVTQFVTYEYFTPDGRQYKLVSSGTADSYDIDMYGKIGSDSSDIHHYYHLTAIGRHVLAIFQSLGYEFQWTNSSALSAQDYNVSAMPILAFLKIFRDWFDDPRFDDFLLDATFKTNYTAWVFVPSGSTPGSGMDDLSVLFNYLVNASFSLMPPDLFNSGSGQAGYATGHSSAFSSVSISSNQQGISPSSTGNLVTDDGSVPYNSQLVYGGSVRVLSDVGLSILESVSKFVRRNNLVGVRYVDQILARFGVKPSEVVSDRCNFLGQTAMNIQIGDVTATSAGSATVDGQTVANSLGDYTGKGIGYSSDGSFTFETGGDTADHGYFIIISCVLPLIKYYQGVDPHVLLTSSPLDFYTPEFDALATEPLENALVRADYQGNEFGGETLTNGGNPMGVFSYVPRYSRLKFAKDKLTGDFRVRSNYESMRCAHLFREIPVPNNDHPLTPNKEFETFGPWQRWNLDRIFLQNDDGYDHFYIRYAFNVNLNSIMKPMYDNIMLNDGDDEHNGEISMPINGRRF